MSNSGGGRFQKKVDVLTWDEVKRIILWQLKKNLHHIGGQEVELIDPNRHFPHHWQIDVEHLWAVKRNVALSHRAAREDVALCFFALAQGLGLMGVVRHLARQELAFARPTSTILTAIGQGHPSHQGGRQQCFSSSRLKIATARFYADRKAHGASIVKRCFTSNSKSMGSIQYFHGLG